MDREFALDIKANCDISDARFWGYFSICGLLLRYRDLFRSEQGLMPWDEIRRQDISVWIQQKEAQWPDLEPRDLRSITVDGRTFDPFDSAGINLALKQYSLVYGAGYGMYLKPTFFLADLVATSTVEGHRVFRTGREHARDLFTAAAQLQEQSIIIRSEPMVALLWDKYQESRSRPSSPISEVFSRACPERGPFEITKARDAVVALATHYEEVLLRHELAESLEDVQAWKELLANAGDRDGEHFLRAVKDLIADTSDHGPLKRIIGTRDRTALGLSAALLDGYRKALFPELGMQAITALTNDDWSVLEQVRTAGYRRFRSLRDEIIDRYRNTGQTAFREALRSLSRSSLGRGRPQKEQKA